jgi:DNA repair protein RadD
VATGNDERILSMLRQYQQDACEAVWNHLCSKKGNPVVCSPTGSGKSWMLAELTRKAIKEYRGRVLLLAHRKELLEQNAEKIATMGIDCGIYSAGLKSRDIDHDCVVAGIQSVYRRAEDFGARHLCIIDEVHLVPRDGEGMYKRFLSDLRRINPHLRLVGLTATPYRLDCGPLCRPDALFQKVCYSASIQELIRDRFLAPLTTKATTAQADLSAVHLRGGEFIPHEAEAAFAGIVEPACLEIVQKATDRHTCLVFCSGIKHAEAVTECLERLTGEDVGLVTGDTFPMTRERILADFKSGRLRWCVNVDVLTTGFDAPNIDLIAVLRGTMSPGLFAQIVGRGFRLHPHKIDCLVLDFGGNIKRHGPIDSPSYGVQDKRQSHPGEAPIKHCPNCESEVLASARECDECGFRFPDPDANHGTQADQAAILSNPITFLVEAVSYALHRKRSGEGPPTLRLDYECQREDAEGNLSREKISEWVCIEHDGYAYEKARRWWADRSRAEFPVDVQEAVSLCERGAVASPFKLTAIKEGRWWRIQSVVLDPVPESWEGAVDPWAEEEVPF